MPMMLTVLCTLFLNVTVPEEKGNVVISSKEEIYTYKALAGQVVVEEKVKSRYTCIRRPEKIFVSEFYDNDSEIKKVSIKGIKGVSPGYEMYQENSLFFTDLKVCYFTLPFSRKDQEVSVSFEKIYKDICYFKLISFAESQFIEDKVIRIVVPDWMEIDILEHNFNNSVLKDKYYDNNEKTTIYTYRIKEHPAIISESYMPSILESHPFLMIIPKRSTINGFYKSYFETFDDLYKWYADLANLTFTDKQLIATHTEHIISGKETEDEKLKSIYGWVQNNIRYLAVADGISRFKPDDAHEVLRKRYGDCKGMANLLKQMLLTQGFDARLAWISSGNNLFDRRAPLPTANHMICALFRNGKIEYLDPTTNYMALGEYHEGIQGKMVMIEDGENYLLEDVPEVMPFCNQDSIYTFYTLNDDETLTGNSVMAVSGEAKEAILSGIHALELSKRDEAIKKFLLKGHSSDYISAFTIKGADEKAETITIDFSEQRTSNIKQMGDELYVDMDIRKDFSTGLIDKEKRKNDILLPFRHQKVSEVRLAFPADYGLQKIPENLNIKNEKYTISIMYEKEDNILIYRKKIIFHDRLIKKEDFEDWNNDISALRKQYLQQVVLKRENNM